MSYKVVNQVYFIILMAVIQLYFSMLMVANRPCYYPRHCERALLRNSLIFRARVRAHARLFFAFIKNICLI